METKDKRKFEKGQSIMVHRHKVGGGFEDVKATFLRAIPKEDRSWILIEGAKKESRKSNQSLYAVGEEYVSPEKYYAEGTKKANKSALKTSDANAKIEKAAKEAKPKAAKKLDTSKGPKTPSKIDRLIIALAKNPKYSEEQAVEEIECTKGVYRDVCLILDGAKAGNAVETASHNAKWNEVYIEKVWTKFKDAK